MKFVIQPSGNSLDIIIATDQYQKFWNEYGERFISTFKNITGLEFQQQVITAYVEKVDYGNAGTSDTPMTLPGSYGALEGKVDTLIHELSHRLLGGNALSPIALGLVPDSKPEDPRFQNFEHKHIYLFLYDVLAKVLGKEYADVCVKKELAIRNPDYQEAWHWAMTMSFEKRQQAIKLLAAQALPRERWHERDGIDIKRRDPSHWFKELS